MNELAKPFLKWAGGKGQLLNKFVDLTKSVKAFDVLSDELTKIGKDTGVQVKCQLEDIFDKMHRI